MGDYVNNGPDSFGTLKLVKLLKRRGALALAGNHEMRWLESKDKNQTLAQIFKRIVDNRGHR